MKICILISRDVLFRPRVLYRLLQKMGKEVSLVAEVQDQTKNTRHANHMKPLRFWGIKGFIMLGLTNRMLRLLGHLPLPSFVRSRLNNKEVCRFFGVPYVSIDDVNTPGFIRKLIRLAPDVIVSIQRQIFGEELLKLPTIACINCHPASLPKYRGFWPVFMAMLNGDESIGVTVHTMTQKIDMGAILMQKEFLTHPGRSLMDNYSLAHELYADTICEALDLLKVKDIGNFTRVPDDAVFYEAPSADDLKRFRSMGLRTV